MKRIVLSLIVLFTLISAANADPISVEAVFQGKDGQTKTRFLPLIIKDSVQQLILPANEIPEGTESIAIYHPWSTAKSGDKGFFVFSNGMYGTFKKTITDGNFANKNVVMPMFGVNTPKGAMCVILSGLAYESEQHITVKKGEWKIFPKFVFNGITPYEDLKIEFHVLNREHASYSDMGRVYRQYQIDRGVVVPIKERMKKRPELEYAAGSMEIRVRMGWKPVPSPVPEQTAETEPPMKTVITFDRFMDIVEEFKKQGISKAEFCLVGWNIGGHDGRYPQIFPPDPRLGGEKKLREAIQKAQKEGYQIVAHTNNSDAYSSSRIGGLWDENYLLRDKDGSPITKTTYGGGNMYQTCPKCMYERFIKSDFEKLSDLGFRGLHYIDVFSTVNPRNCWSKDHPLNKKGYALWTNRIFADAQKTFGGLASEGGYDWCISDLDYSLCNSFGDPKKLNRFTDRMVPIWNIVYNGFVLCTPFRVVWNYTLEEPFYRLKLIEFGGRPMFYFYAKFRHSGQRLFGESDIVCGTDAELIESVKKIKQGYEEFEKLKSLQTEFMDIHEEIDQNVFRTVFSNGTEIISNYREDPYQYRGTTIGPVDYKVFRK
ncbi:MAG: DUF5696 domain-containing protein [Planctomycetia bacterium]|nr:DUF5696 domain-containing protein [Planctomycetia bacterium]